MATSPAQPKHFRGKRNEAVDIQPIFIPSDKRRHNADGRTVRPSMEASVIIKILNSGPISSSDLCKRIDWMSRMSINSICRRVGAIATKLGGRGDKTKQCWYWYIPKHHSRMCDIRRKFNKTCSKN